MEKFPRSWEALSLPVSFQLNEAIRQLHHAAQFVALSGESLLSKADDDSQNSMQWNDEVGGLIGLPLPLKQPVRVAFVFESFSLHLVDERLRTLTHLHLMGQTKVEALRWLREAIGGLGGKEIRPIQHFTLPPHPLDNGAPFEKPGPELLRELARQRHNANELFRDFAVSYAEVTAVRVWPHHFDTGLVLPVSFADNGKASQTIGVGLAMPDEQFDEPYFYVNHWSAEGELHYEDLPELPGSGRWHRNGWTGAVLRLSHLLSAADAPQQRERARSFLRRAEAATREILSRVGQET